MKFSSLFGFFFQDEKPIQRVLKDCVVDTVWMPLSLVTSGCMILTAVSVIYFVRYKGVISLPFDYSCFQRRQEVEDNLIGDSSDDETSQFELASASIEPDTETVGNADNLDVPCVQQQALREVGQAAVNVAALSALTVINSRIPVKIPAGKTPGEQEMVEKTPGEQTLRETKSRENVAEEQIKASESNHSIGVYRTETQTFLSRIPVHVERFKLLHTDVAKDQNEMDGDVQTA